jgi:folate-dependent phosphoribosylglycinamide formyltransferase PurN
MSDQNKMIKRVVLLATHPASIQLAEIIVNAASDVKVILVYDKEVLQSLADEICCTDILISKGTSIIVPYTILNKFGAAYNFHSASPDYPGRDAHHFAAYDAVVRYGATAHIMSEYVDSGHIIDVELFDAPPKATPADLLALANEASLKLFRRLIPRMISGEVLPSNGASWGRRKTSREDFKRLCRIPPYVGIEEFELIRHATFAPGYNNSYIDLHGCRFRYEGPSDAPLTDWSDFTEAAYSDILDMAKSRYRFATFGERGADRHVLWRHDIDHSVHRGLKLAEIEQSKGLISTYFFMPVGISYALAEPAVRDRARQILALGHRAGLHFNSALNPEASQSFASFEQEIIKQRDFVESILEQPLEAVSFHNPTLHRQLSFDQPVLAGLVNAYGHEITNSYGYCSDSNGYWRFTHLRELLLAKTHDRLHVLTHPEWWTPTAMPPRSRIERCVLGRAAAVMRLYDDGMERGKRENLDR